LCYHAVGGVPRDADFVSAVERCDEIVILPKRSHQVPDFKGFPFSSSGKRTHDAVDTPKATIATISQKQTHSRHEIEGRNYQTKPNNVAESRLFKIGILEMTCISGAARPASDSGEARESIHIDVVSIDAGPAG
jgi:hypothetical protein